MTPHFIISFKIQPQSQGRKLYKNLPKQAKLLLQGINEAVRVYNSHIQMENSAKIFNSKVNVVFINMIFTFFHFSSLYEQYHVTSVPSLCQWYNNLYKPFCQLSCYDSVLLCAIPISPLLYALLFTCSSKRKNCHSFAR